MNRFIASRFIKPVSMVAVTSATYLAANIRKRVTGNAIQVSIVLR
ncbi:MAG: hypothetical protein ACF8CQ_05340 [Rhodopirellula sp. JB044]